MSHPKRAAARASAALAALLAALLAGAPAAAFSARLLDDPGTAGPEAEGEASRPAGAADPYAVDPPPRADEPEPAPAGTDPYARDPDLYSDDADDDDDALYGDPLPEPDPFEPVNRRVFRFNEGVDRFVLDPATRAYTFVMPDPAERAVLRVFRNLNSPTVLVNDVLQLEFERAGVTLTRFVVNSSVGLAGIFDVAQRMGLEGHTADFGQTLANLGVGSGPYIVIPVLGPSTVRDAVGFGVDLLFRPLFYLLGPIDFLIVGTGNGFVVRSSYMDELEALRESSVDFYATLRNVYFQRRAEQLREIGVEVASDDAGP